MVAKFLIVAMLASSHVPVVVNFTLLRDSLVVIPVQLNGHGPYKFLLDTGATHSILSTAVAGELGILAGRSNRIITAGGSITVAMGVVEALEIGPVRISKATFAITGNDLLPTLHVDGIIGGDCLKQFKVLIDYKHKQLSIEP